MDQYSFFFLFLNKLQEKFEPELKVWIAWTRKLGEGYKTLLKGGHKADMLNAQIDEFFRASF